jgi:hypothetical protein
MTTLTSLTAALLRGGRRMTGGLLAAALLIPVPAMALTFTSNWSATYPTPSGAPTPIKPSFTDATVGQRDDLTVDMGTYQGTGGMNKGGFYATSTINLTRGFSVTQAGGQNVFAEADYATYLADAGLAVSEQVKDSKGHLIMDLSGGIFNEQNTSGTKTLYANSASTTQKIADGNYTLTVSITYNTNNKIGSWSMKSKHHFEAIGE